MYYADQRGEGDRREHGSPVGLAISGYELLRLKRIRWRQLLDGMLSPAIRLHRLRNTRTRMWRDAVCDLDCRHHGRNRPDR